MKTSLSPASKFPNFRPLRILLPLAAMAFLPACATSTWFKQADSTLPIETVPTQSSTVASIRAHETSDRLYVAGIARTAPFGATHIDVQLIGLNGRVVAEDRDALDSPAHPQTARGHHRTQSYVVSFPLSEARQAVKIRVISHRGGHPKVAS